MATAPLGYKNKINEEGRKYIAPDEPKARIIKWIFETIASGVFTTEQIWKQSLQKGFKCSKHGFWVIIRNPVYCGKIFIPKYKDEEAHFVQGQHEPLIAESLFYEAQEVLDGKKKHQRTKLMIDDMLPLRGFLICPKCGKLLTGSASRGCKKRYYYYHCNSACGCRFNVTRANELFVSELRKFVPRKEMVEVYKTVLRQEFTSSLTSKFQMGKQINQQLDELNKKLQKARNLLLSEVIDAADYRLIKTETDEQMKRLEAKLISVPNHYSDIDKLIDKALQSFVCLDDLYLSGDSLHKREIISSIFPEKLIFDGKNYRTTRLNEAVQLICKLDKAFGQNKKEHNGKFSEMFPKVTL